MWIFFQKKFKPNNPIDEDDIDRVNINDDAAYDMDEDDDEAQYINNSGNEPKKHHQKYDYDYNYDLELDNITDIITERQQTSTRRHENNRSSSNSRSKKHHHKSSASTSRSKKSSRNKYDDDDDENELVSIKSMLKGVLEMHISNLDDNDEELRATLENLLDQVTDDNDSLTYEDCVNIHKTVKGLFEDQDEGEESENEDVRRRRRKHHGGLSDDNMADDRSRKSKKKKSKSRRRNDDEADRHRLNAEVEAGEIDDVYDDGDELVVEKEFKDLLLKNNRSNY